MMAQYESLEPLAFKISCLYSVGSCYQEGFGLIISHILCRHIFLARVRVLYNHQRRPGTAT
jgi:hypothetical protein